MMMNPIIHFRYKGKNASVECSLEGRLTLVIEDAQDLSDREIRNLLLLIVTNANEAFDEWDRAKSVSIGLPVPGKAFDSLIGGGHDG